VRAQVVSLAGVRALRGRGGPLIHGERILRGGRNVLPKKGRLRRRLHWLHRKKTKKRSIRKKEKPRLLKKKDRATRRAVVFRNNLTGEESKISC